LAPVAISTIALAKGSGPDRYTVSTIRLNSASFSSAVRKCRRLDVGLSDQKTVEGIGVADVTGTLGVRPGNRKRLEVGRRQAFRQSVNSYREFAVGRLDGDFEYRCGADVNDVGIVEGYLDPSLKAIVISKEENVMTDLTKEGQRTVAITGAGGGLGRATALAFAVNGYRVFGTARKPEEIADLKEASGGTVSLTTCDITDEAAVAAWAREVAAQTNGRLDLLIQNAGTLTPGPLEALKLDAIKHEFDVNVFGALSVTNAFLPALRKQRGRIVYISTWTASLPLPFNGPSGASKAALEVIAAIHRVELKPFGVEVVIAAPGNMRTGGPALVAAALQKIADDFTDDQRKLYGRTFGTFANNLNAMQRGVIPK
jgi:NAD(P)-dependent dehydrogenase (short-subunit alcohol dehydrogenase family)